MRFFVFACLAFVSCALELTKVEEPITDEYIVLYHANVSESLRLSHMEGVETHSKIMFKYDFPGFYGFSAVMKPKGLSLVLDSELVAVVEENGVARIVEEDLGEPLACDSQVGATWGIVRTCERNNIGSQTYVYDTQAGQGVTTYVVDTGIYTAHSDFGGRAVWGANFVDSDDTDGNGHGTHVASTMVGQTYGLAKYATVKAVKVLSAGGSGSMSGVIAGVNWVVTDAMKLYKKGKRVAKAVGNMSLGGSKSTTLNNAVDAAFAADVVFVNAAGNDNGNACNYSPASAEDGVSVGSTTSSDARSSFSNYGTCVDIFAPGSSITAAWIGGTTRTNTISGTSMAAPHVAGIVAKLMQENSDYDAAKIVDELYSIGTSGALSGVPTASPNLLTYQACSA